MDELLIVFARCPEPGRAKTRLIPHLGAQGAADLQRDMTRHLLRRIRTLRRMRPVAVESLFAGGSAGRMRELFGGDIDFRPQCEGDLGRRMFEGFRRAFERGYRRVVLMGVDVPDLDAPILARAFESLRRRDVVIGPARDGGYCLIGMRRPIPELFRDVPWSTPETLGRTERIALRMGLRVAHVDTLDDVDLPEDLPVWEAARRAPDASPERISIIIPTLNEAYNLPGLLQGLPHDSDTEVIVADGGSADDTAAIAAEQGARVVGCPPGRAGQMNAGAAVATGSILLFLHADTRLPGGFPAHVRAALADDAISLGAFRLRIDHPSGRLRLIERLANARSTLLRMPYGDQALFLRAGLFRRLGGFPRQPLMEDFDFVRRARRHGGIVILSASALTSARRWLLHGPLRTTLLNQLIIAAHLAGVSTERLARWYRNRGEGS